MSKFKFFNLLFLILAISVLTFGQTPQTVPTPPPPPDDGEVVVISTTLIQFDVVVTDKKGSQITDLKPEDFEIFINGEKQKIENFSYIFSKQSDSENKKTDDKSNQTYSVPPPPSKLKLEQVRRTYAIVVDDLGLSFENVPDVKRALRKFINEQMQDGDLVAIVSTGGGIGALQSFTTDKNRMLAAVEKIKWNPQGRSGVSSFDAVGTTLKEDLEGRIDSESNVKEIYGVEEEKQFLKENEGFRRESFARGTLGALNYVIRGMKQLPGRKSLIVFSEDLGTSASSNGASGNISEALKSLADLANRSSIIIYTIDPRGLQNPYSATGADSVRVEGIPGLPGGFNTNPNYTDARDERAAEFRDTQEGLRYLAYETGGVPFLNQNNLNLGLEKAINDQQGYYLIGYQPDADVFDEKTDKFNKVTINVKRNDLKVRYRSGFFGISDEKVEKPKNQTPEQQIFSALTSPFGVNDISLSLNTLFADDTKNGAFIRSLITVDAKDLKFNKDSGGLYKANVDILAVTFSDQGAAIENTAKNYTITLDENAYQKVLKTGFVYNLLVPIKKAGFYQFRVAIRDSTTAKVGSASQFIEVPNLKKNQLTLSSIVLDNFAVSATDKNSNGGALEINEKSSEIDTASRHFKRGTYLRYLYVIYNAKTNPAELQVQVRLFRDGKLFLENKPSPLDIKGQTDLKRIETGGTITLGKNLAPGEYVLQVIIIDNRAKGNSKIASRWIDFEIIE